MLADLVAAFLLVNVVLPAVAFVAVWIAVEVLYAIFPAPK